MNLLRAPVIVFGCLCLGLLIFVSLSAPLLPERVASHFNASGQPDGWMAREQYLWFTGVMGLALPLFIIGLTFITRFLPDWMINLPHKAYWLSPEQRPWTQAYLFGHSFWLGSLVIGLMGASFYLTIQANRSDPVQLPGTTFAVLMGGFLIGVAVWAISLVRHFRTPA